MTLAELIAEVYTLTGRPDRVAETLSAVKAATLKAHQSDYYYKDLFESGLDMLTADFTHSFDYRQVLPRWRALKYLRKLDYPSNVPGKMLTVVQPESVLDDYKIQKTDICYVAGAYVQINCATEQRYFLLGCYLNPDVNQNTYSSWIAQDHPYAIVFDATATVFKAIGKDEETAQFRGLVMEQIAMIKMSNITATGM
jgi:hypothetical protein